MNFIALTIIACLIGVGSDIYAPSIPQIAADINTSINLSQFSMTSYMYGLAVGQILFGAWSDAIGRKKPLIIGTCIFLFGCIFAFVANNIEWLIFARFMQGFGAAASSIWRSILRDSYSGPEMSRYAGYLSAVFTFVVPASPIIGSYIQKYLSWRYNFIFLAFIAVIVLITSFRIKNQAEFLKFNLKNYLIPISDKKFVIYSICALLNFGALFSWMVIGPVLLIDVLGYEPTFFSWATMILAGSMIALSGLINGKIVLIHGSKKVLIFGWLIMLFAGITMFLSYFTFDLNLVALLIPLAIFYFGIGFIFINCFTLAFERLGESSGVATSVYSSIQTLGAMIIGTIAAKAHVVNPLLLACIITFTSTMSILITRKD